MLGIAKTSSDAARVHEWSSNAGKVLLGMASTLEFGYKEFPDLLHELLMQRYPVDNINKDVNLKDINAMLDNLERGVDKVQLFRAITLELPIPQQILFVRIVLQGYNESTPSC